MAKILVPRILMCDNDGTLVDSEYAHHTSISKVVNKHGGGPIDNKEWWKYCSGKGHIKIHEWLNSP